MKLSEILSKFRSDRPDEWIMDEWAAKVEKLECVLEAAVNLVTASSWKGVSDEDCELERALKECGYVEDE